MYLFFTPGLSVFGSFFLSSYFFIGKLSYRSVRPGSLKQLNRVKCTVTGGVTVRSTIFTGLSPVIRWICPGQYDLVYWVIFSLPCPDEELGSDGGARLGTRHPSGQPTMLGQNFLVAKCLSDGNYTEWIESFIQRFIQNSFYRVSSLLECE